MIPIKKDDTVYSLYKKIYKSEDSLYFIKNCLEKYEDIKINKLSLGKNAKYNSYPKFFDITLFFNIIC